MRCSISETERCEVAMGVQAANYAKVALDNVALGFSRIFDIGFEESRDVVLESDTMDKLMDRLGAEVYPDEE